MVIGTECKGSCKSKWYFKDIIFKIVTAVIRSQPVLNSQTIIQIFTRDSCDFLWFLLICFNYLESAAPAYVALVYISQLMRYFPRTFSYQDLLEKSLLLTRKLLNQGFLLGNLKLSLRKFYNRHHDLVNRYQISVSHTTTYAPLVVGTSRSLSGPFLIHELSPDL